LPAASANVEMLQVIARARAEVVAEQKSGAAWGRLGQAFEAGEFPAQARDCYARAAEFEPMSARWPHLLGLLQLQDSPTAALTNLALATRRADPTNDAPRLRLAQALAERGRFAEATDQLAPLLAARPDHPAARLELARVRLAENQPAAAAELLTPCLTNPYTARPAVLLLSQARVRTGDAEGAGALARRAAAMPRPFDWPDPFLREVQALKQDRARLAERANVQVIQRRFLEAERTLTNLLAEFPDDPEALLVLGRLRLQQGRCADAEATLRRHLAAQTNSLNGLIQLGLALMCQSRWADAGEVFGRAVRVKPDFAQAHFNLGLARSRAGDPAGAIASLRETIRCSPGDANAHAVLAEELARTGAKEEADRHIERALSLDPGNARARALRDRSARR
jgi:tetratricopeptide (TPR) repeat protein